MGDMMTEELARPLPLGRFLDAGGDPAAVGVDIWRFFRDILIDRACGDPGRAPVRHQTAAEYRRCVDAALGDDPGSAPCLHEPPAGAGWDSLQQYVTAMSWLADLEEDPDLAPRVRRLLDSDREAELARLVDQARRPHPLLVGRLEQPSRCEGCGTALDRSTAVLTVGYQPGSSGEVEAGPWCTRCVKEAYGALLSGGRVATRPAATAR